MWKDKREKKSRNERGSRIELDGISSFTKGKKDTVGTGRREKSLLYIILQAKPLQYCDVFSL